MTRAENRLLNLDGVLDKERTYLSKERGIPDYFVVLSKGRVEDGKRTLSVSTREQGHTEESVVVISLHVDNEDNVIGLSDDHDILVFRPASGRSDTYYALQYRSDEGSGDTAMVTRVSKMVNFRKAEQLEVGMSGFDDMVRDAGVPSAINWLETAISYAMDRNPANGKPLTAKYIFETPLVSAE